MRYNKTILLEAVSIALVGVDIINKRAEAAYK